MDDLVLYFLEVSMKFFSQTMLMSVALLSGCAEMPKDIDAVLKGVFSPPPHANNNTRTATNYPTPTIATTNNVDQEEEFGKYMDQSDRERAQHTAYKAFIAEGPTTVYDTWTGKNGATFNIRVMTQRPGYPNFGQYSNTRCKVFTQEITVRFQGYPKTAMINGLVCPEWKKEYQKEVWVLKAY